MVCMVRNLKYFPTWFCKAIFLSSKSFMVIFFPNEVLNLSRIYISVWCVVWPNFIFFFLVFLGITYLCLPVALKISFDFVVLLFHYSTSHELIFSLYWFLPDSYESYILSILGHIQAYILESWRFSNSVHCLKFILDMLNVLFNLRGLNFIFIPLSHFATFWVASLNLSFIPTDWTWTLSSESIGS